MIQKRCILKSKAHLCRKVPIGVYQMFNVASSLIGLIIVILLYISGLILAVVMLAVAISLGIRWGGTWLLKDISKDPQLVHWLKHLLNSPEK